MTNLESRLWKYHLRHYSEKVDLPATFRKLCEEVGELGEALMDKDFSSAKMEAGDVAVVLFVLIRGLGLDGLSAAMAKVEDKLNERDRQD